MKLLSVLIEYRVSSLNTPFTYVCDDSTKVVEGCRVYVPFGTQKIVGYVIKVTHSPLSLEQLNKKENIEYKYIYEVFHSIAEYSFVCSFFFGKLCLYTFGIDFVYCFTQRTAFVA